MSLNFIMLVRRLVGRDAALISKVENRNHYMFRRYQILLTAKAATRNDKNALRYYISLIFLFVPALLFGVLLILYKDHPKIAISADFPYLPWQFYVIAICGVIGTIGGTLDWQYHRNPLNMKIPPKERDAEALALGTGGLPIFILMWLATLSADPIIYLIPITIVLIYTVVAICYDEFVFHIKRCDRLETIYHRMLVFGNGAAWLSWFHFIYY
ncbi:MAG: hypothetical protein ACK4TA_24565 [Saprospiraceae bacterium]